MRSRAVLLKMANRRDSKIALEVIRPLFVRLSKALIQNEIPETLFSMKLIDYEILEIYSKREYTDREKGLKIIHAVRNTIEIEPKSFQILCDILAGESITKDLSTELLASYDKLAAEKEANNSRHSELCDDFEILQEELEFFKKKIGEEENEEIYISLMQSSCQKAIKKAFNNNESIDSVRNQIWFLCNEQLVIPPQLHKWALKEVEDIQNQFLSSMIVSPPEICMEPAIPLFSKETVYNASLSCHAISTCTAANFHTFFDNISSGHNFEEASISISRDRANVDRYMISRQDNNIYIAVQSEALLTDWIDCYSSFEDGLMKQLARIPIRFLVEQLREQKRLILTGFSFGGMLACCIAANLWRESYISDAILTKNVVCITFAQPLISIKFLEEATKDYPQLEKIIHSIFCKADVVPSILQYFGIGCVYYRGSRQTSLKALTAAETGGVAPKQRKELQEFKHEYAQLLLKNLATLQMDATEAIRSQALDGVQEALKAVMNYTAIDSSPIYGNCYIISSENGKGLTCNNYSRKMAAVELAITIPAVDALEENLFKKHNMGDYRRDVFRSHLDKGADKYSPPGPSKQAIKDMVALKPKVTKVEFHNYPNEHVVVLEGNNLWFCHGVRLGEKDNILNIEAQYVTGRSIQFNFPPSKKTEGIIAHDTVKVCLHSHFANPIRQTIPVAQEPYSFSLRQIQLAKHTPTEVIELAFWSAMLEQYPRKRASDHGPSKRFKKVVNFFEEAIQVVPCESILSAIAYSNEDIALACASALESSKIKIPYSELMIANLQTATVRMRTGLLGEQIDDIVASSYKRLSVQFPFNDVAFVSVSAPSKDEIKVSIIAPQRRIQTYSEVANRTRVPDIWIPSVVATSCINIVPHSPVATHPVVADFLEKKAEKQANAVLPPREVVSNLSIGHIYPSISDQRRHSTRISSLQSPIDVLRSGREKLCSFIEGSQESASSSQGTELENEQMLHLIRDLHEHSLKICASLLGAFMEQQISIPLLTSPLDTAKVLSSRSDPVAMGVWALFSMGKSDLEAILSSSKTNSLSVRIADYVTGVLSEDLKQPASGSGKYAGKLQALSQLGMKKTVTSSSQYISYSLEHQLCNNLRFKKTIPVKQLIDNWYHIFKDDALSLVAKSHRPLIARWLKWAVLIHDLRETLANYTCIGIIGLVNSGKSRLVNELFDLQAPVGTTERKRTTVPLLYNLDDKVDGLDVIDFPGVDDEDNSVPGLAKLLLGLVQVVIFVVDYRRLFTKTTKEWLHRLEEERDIPVLVCLTHADQLYVECMADENSNPEPTMLKKQKIGEDLFRKLEKIGDHPSRTVKFSCFHLVDPRLTAENLHKVGIGSAKDVGEWLETTFRGRLKQSELAEKLHVFIDKKK